MGVFDNAPSDTTALVRLAAVEQRLDELEATVTTDRSTAAAAVAGVSDQLAATATTQQGRVDAEQAARGREDQRTRDLIQSGGGGGGGGATIDDELVSTVTVWSSDKIASEYLPKTDALVAIAGAGALGVSVVTAATLPALKAVLSLAKTDVGLGSVDNSADVDKPVSVPQQTALNLKADKASPVFTGVPRAPAFNTQQMLVSDVTVTVSPAINGVLPGYLTQILGTSANIGTLMAKWSNDTKGVLDIICKSRGSAINVSGAIQAGDKIYSQALYGDSGLGYMAHIGQVVWAIDGAPLGDPTELPGWYGIYTGSGFHSPGNRIAFEINSRQQVHIPGPISNPLGPTGASYGANLLLGAGGSGAGGAPLKFILTGALLATPEAGAIEGDATDLYFTNGANVRRRVLGVDSANALSTGLTIGGAFRKKQYTVSTLPLSPATGDEYVVTDANAPAWGSVLAGSGAIVCTAMWNGSNYVAR